MTLGFQTRWPAHMGELAGQPNYFVDKIWLGLPQGNGEYDNAYYAHINQFGEEWDLPDVDVNFCKLHTIRHDPHDRWKPGMKIHPVINNRTKNRFQFAPVMECMSVQSISIKHAFPHRYIHIDGRYISEWSKMNELALNDGFPSVEAFFQYFNKDFSGKIIHWTGLGY